MASSTLAQTNNLQAYPERKRFTVHDFHAMIEAGVFREDDRLELLEGEIVEMSPIGIPHATCVRKLNHLLNKLVEDAIVDVQNPLRLTEASEIYPDVMVLKADPDLYADKIPTAQDTLLVIEVSDSTIKFDRTVKLSSYAEAGVPEVWIVDLQGERVLVHRTPLDGVYGQVKEVNKDEVLTIATLENAKLKVADIL